jgi:hypothetical protein
LSLVIGSNPDDWHAVEGGHTYLDAFSAETSFVDDQESRWLGHSQHHGRAVFKPDISIGMAWGMPRDRDGQRFFEDWIARFADETAYAAWLDLLYHGQPVHRYLYIVVDGGRCKIPLPEQTFSGDLNPHEVRRWIGYDAYRLFSVLNALDSSHDYEAYLDRSGLDVNRTP